MGPGDTGVSPQTRGRAGAYPPPPGMNQRRRLAGGLGILAAAGLAGRIACRFERVEVVGESMRPSLAPGDRLLVLRGGPVREGAVVALDDPRDERRVMVKRVGAVLAGSVTVYGDNSDFSTDSRHFGPVDITAVHGPVLYRYGPAERAGRLDARSRTLRG